MPTDPLPPPELRNRVAGTPDAEWFGRSGEMTLRDLRAALDETLGVSFDAFTSIYDFGCGAGRLTRWLATAAPEATIWASDIDGEAVEWLRAAMPRINAYRNDWLPPLLFRNGLFDLIVGWSVFTHLPEDYQDAWLGELRRVAAPGAIVLLTVHGLYHWSCVRDRQLSERADDTVTTIARQLDCYGYAYLTADGNDEFPSFYHTAWHAPGYIRSHWAQLFSVLDVREQAGLVETGFPHDVVVLRRD